MLSDDASWYHESVQHNKRSQICPCWPLTTLTPPPPPPGPMPAGPSLRHPPTGSVCFLSTLFSGLFIWALDATRPGPATVCVSAVSWGPRSRAARMGDKDPILLHRWHIQSSHAGFCWVGDLKSVFTLHSNGAITTSVQSMSVCLAFVLHSSSVFTHNKPSKTRNGLSWRFFGRWKS